MLKRTFDLVASLIALILLSPLFLLIAMAIGFDSGRPILFRQTRVGMHGQLFNMHKFRTMIDRAERSGKLTIGDDPRITRVGAFLRKHKLDELPQLVDVLTGKMSMVGPRPEVPEYVAHYSPASRSRILSVRPGITDRASLVMIDEAEILSRYDKPHQAYIAEILPRKERMYVEYVQNRTFCGDLRIIGETIRRLFR